MPRGLPVGKPAVNSVMTAPGVIRPTPPSDSSLNQRLPSGPFAIPHSATFELSPSPNSETLGPPSPVASAVPEPTRATQSATASEIRVRT